MGWLSASHLLFWMSFLILLFSFLIWAFQPTLILLTKLLNVFLLMTIPWPNQLQLSPAVRPTRFLLEAPVKCKGSLHWKLDKTEDAWARLESESWQDTCHRVESCVALVSGEQAHTQLSHSPLEFNTSVMRSETREILADKNKSMLSFHWNPFNFFINFFLPSACVLH